MAKIIMGNLVRQNPAQLIIRGTVEQSGSHIELAVSCARGINSGVVHNLHAHLAWVATMICCSKERQHYPLQTLNLRSICRPVGRGGRGIPEVPLRPGKRFTAPR
jgi:hypothetical protein